MSALFTLASTQYLVNSAPVVTAVPFTVGVWYNHTALSAVGQTIFCLADTATSNNYWNIDISATEAVRIGATGGGTTNNILLTASAVVPGSWLYILARYITATNRRVAVYYMDTGLVEHGNTTTSRSPTGIDTQTIGALNLNTVTSPLGGSVAEYFLANIDIQADGLQLDDATIRQLAFGGPFSIPHIVPNIIEYRSFRVDPTAEDGKEVYYGSTLQPYVNTNGATTAAHPPLPYWYVKPGQYKPNLVI